MTSSSGTRRSLLAALLAGTALSATPAFAEETYRFGLALPLTGSQALYGQDQVKAAQWAVDDINKAGGINGKKLEMIVLDTQADPQVGINAVNKLVQVDRVPALVTAFSQVVKAVAPIADDNKVVELVVGANSPNIAELGDYVYTTYPLADIDMVALTKYLYGTAGKKKAAILYINNESGSVGADMYRKSFTALGGQVVAFEAYGPKATDFTGQILKARSAAPDTIHIHGLVADTPQVIAQMRQLGLSQTITSYAAIYNPKLIETLGPAAEGIIVTSLAPGAAENPAVGKLIDRWKTELKREPNGLPYVEYLYDAPYIVADVFKSLDKKGIKPTGEAFRTEMLALKTFESPMTGKTVIENSHTVKKPVYLMQVKGGKWTHLVTLD